MNNLSFSPTDTQDKEKEKEKPKVNKQTSQEKESKPAPRESRIDSGGSYEVPPPKGNDPIRIQCREMLVKSLKLEDRPGLPSLSFLVSLKFEEKI